MMDWVLWVVLASFFLVLVHIANSLRRIAERLDSEHR